MVYVDTSVALAHLLAEDRSPPDHFWGQILISSRLLEYELWTRIHARGLARSHAEHARDLLARIAFVELTPLVLKRALEPFANPVRTLDALHLASALFLAARAQDIQVATYDERLAVSAKALDLPLYPL